MGFNYAELAAKWWTDDNDSEAKIRGALRAPFKFCEGDPCEDEMFQLGGEHARSALGSFAEGFVINHFPQILPVKIYNAFNVLYTNCMDLGEGALGLEAPNNETLQSFETRVVRQVRQQFGPFTKFRYEPEAYDAVDSARVLQVALKTATMEYAIPFHAGCRMDCGFPGGLQPDEVSCKIPAKLLDRAMREALLCKDLTQVSGIAARYAEHCQVMSLDEIARYASVGLSPEQALGRRM